MMIIILKNLEITVPQHVTIKMKQMARIKRVGFLLHGENNQNPKHVQIFLSNDNKNFEKVVDAEIEQKAGDYIYEFLPNQEVQTKSLQDIWESTNENEKKEEWKEALFVKFEYTQNYGGSGIYVSKVFVFGELLN